MGQRFQIILNRRGDLKVIHFQWLYGMYAIRRIGTAIRGYMKQKHKFYEFKEYLYGSCYGKFNDMNSFCDYYDAVTENRDNEYILDKKRIGRFETFLKTLDNNDGFLYLKFDEKNNIQYCFITRNDNGEFIKHNAKQYLTTKEWYSDKKGYNKKQMKEFEDGMKTFNQLECIDYPKSIRRD